VAISTRPELALVAVDLQGGGIAAAREMLARLPRLQVVMVADDGAELVAAFRAGAAGYLLRDMSLERLPQTLWEAASGDSVAMPRSLMQELLNRFRDPNALRRTMVEGEPLTSREWQILSLLRTGLSTAQVSQRLSISVATVRSHRRRIRRKIQGVGATA
jgi:DNA-binding NarL/FixJ family response regulator